MTFFAPRTGLIAPHVRLANFMGLTVIYPCSRIYPFATNCNVTSILLNPDLITYKHHLLMKFIEKIEKANANRVTITRIIIEKEDETRLVELKNRISETQTVLVGLGTILAFSIGVLAAYVFWPKVKLRGARRKQNGGVDEGNDDNLESERVYENDNGER